MDFATVLHPLHIQNAISYHFQDMTVNCCPAFLQPLYISANSLKGDFDKAEEHRALDCIECGSCSFICPARRPLVESIRNAKRQIQAKRRKAQAEAKAKAAK